MYASREPSYSSPAAGSARHPRALCVSVTVGPMGPAELDARKACDSLLAIRADRRED